MSENSSDMCVFPAKSATQVAQEAGRSGSGEYTPFHLFETWILVNIVDSGYYHEPTTRHRVVEELQLIDATIC